MKQLNLFSERRSDTIRDFKNEIASYMDILSETSEKISYSGRIFSTDPTDGIIEIVSFKPSLLISSIKEFLYDPSPNMSNLN